MKAEISAIHASPWVFEDSKIRREVHLKTEIGLRSQYLSMQFIKSDDGAMAPMFMILTNYRMGQHDPGKPWLGLRLSVNDLEVATAGGSHKPATDGDAVAVFDVKDFNQITKALSSDLNLLCEIEGEFGILATFPIPAEGNFRATFAQLVGAQ